MSEKELRIKDGDVPVSKPQESRQRLVTFELLPDGFKIIRNDCVSMLEFRGLISEASELFKKK
jgi:hypothetical protein